MHAFSLRVPMFTLLCALSGFSPGVVAAAPPELGSGGNVELMVAPRTLRSDQVTLVWRQQGSGTAKTYQVLCDGKPVESTAHTFYTVKDLQPGKEYVFQVGTPAVNDTTGQSQPVRVRTLAKERVLPVTDFGAKGDGTTVNTKAIQAAIDACPANGVVLIPRGVFVSGALFLKSDMTLEVAAGATLQGSAAPADYEPFIPNRFEGWELATYASLLNAGKIDRRGPANVRNLSIRGAGRIAGGGAPLGDAMIAAHGLRSRGRLICLMNCAHVEIQGVSLETPPSWTLHFIYSEDVSCHDLTITTAVRNGDGIDPDSSKNTYIFNCAFSTGDDCIAIKSGKNPEGNVVNRPTENVWVFGCRFLAGHGISIGSEISGGVRGVMVEDCVAGNLLHGLQIKGTKERGAFVEDITVRNCDLQKISILTALPYNNDGEPASEEPYFRNFRFINLDLSTAKPSTAVVLVNGFPAEGHRTRHVVFEKIKLPAGAIVEINRAEDVSFSGVTCSDGGRPTFKVIDSGRVVH